MKTIDHSVEVAVPEVLPGLEARTFGVLRGDPQSGKTSLALYLGLAAAAGQDPAVLFPEAFAQTLQPSRVVYVSAGDGEGSVRRIVRAIAKTWPALSPTARFRHIDVRQGGIDLVDGSRTSGSFLNTLRDYCREADLLILDPLAAFTGSLNDAYASDMSALCNGLLSLQGDGLAVIGIVSPRAEREAGGMNLLLERARWVASIDTAEDSRKTAFRVRATGWSRAHQVAVGRAPETGVIQRVVAEDKKPVPTEEKAAAEAAQRPVDQRRPEGAVVHV